MLVFPGLGFKVKNLCVMFVFAIVYFMFFSEYQFAEGKTSKEEGGDVYLVYSNTHAYHEAWLIDSGESFHMTPHSEWFCKYGRHDGGNVFLGDDSTTRIIG